MAKMLRLVAASLALVPTTLAAVQRQCPAQNVCFSLNIPDQTLADKTDDIFLQLTAPTTYSWVGVAQGMQMNGANYFIMYTSANGNNVTVSTRSNNAGHSMPIHTANTEFELLAGSGVANGVMTANIKCSNCKEWSGGTMDLSDNTPSTSWIYAFLPGTPLNTDSVSAMISEHETHGNFNFDRTSHGGPDTNPFLNLTATNTTSTPASGGGDASNKATIIRAHAVLACLAWAFLFPLGGIMIRLFSFHGLVWMHAGVQVLGLCLYVAAVGLGLSVAIGEYTGDKHAVIGLVLFAVFFFQPLSGIVHHTMFKKYISRTLWSHIHLWIGRLGITLGMINAGFGFQLHDKSMDNWEVKAYTACAVVVFVAYVASVLFGEVRRTKRGGNGSMEMKGSGSEAQG
ncbi:CBD9-like protein [Byssothecium circinans]|uniref:CBD9-like protein n=1 Tax=Byssothecium circinans TaxID=147558 RepID=A0A6A5TQ89_9PLEO|nr:CBD9-like protein [Byssothecium circinans]